MTTRVGGSANGPSVPVRPTEGCIWTFVAGVWVGQPPPSTLSGLTTNRLLVASSATAAATPSSTTTDQALTFTAVINVNNTLNCYSFYSLNPSADSICGIRAPTANLSFLDLYDVSSVGFAWYRPGGSNNIRLFNSVGGDIVNFSHSTYVCTFLKAAFGYGAGNGGTVTQATSKSTGVTLNKASGAITMNAAALLALTSVGFTLTNSVIEATDVIICNIKSGATADSYTVTVDAIGSGTCRISIRNASAGSLSEAVVINFAVIKAAST